MRRGTGVCVTLSSMAETSGVPSAADLLRSLGLSVDGPARWGALPGARTPGIFVIETTRPSDETLPSEAVRSGLAAIEPDVDLESDVESAMWWPAYAPNEPA